ncbi:hypothetical protein SESBI_19214 [Sesbania bispinosa]|nr:hypothetical protein SESBI_19214 [Sesbania bispinosa]
MAASSPQNYHRQLPRLHHWTPSSNATKRWFAPSSTVSSNAMAKWWFTPSVTSTTSMGWCHLRRRRASPSDLNLLWRGAWRRPPSPLLTNLLELNCKIG